MRQARHLASAPGFARGDENAIAGSLHKLENIARGPVGTRKTNPRSEHRQASSLGVPDASSKSAALPPFGVSCNKRSKKNQYQNNCSMPRPERAPSDGRR
jgi:hypothetical protein